MTPMYLEHFGIADAPFSIAPDPRYLFMSSRHREALAHLLYGVKSDDGFVVLTGEVGTGKTTVCRCLLEQIPANCDVALIFNPKLSVLELLAAICEEFRITVPEARPGVKAYIDRINSWLLAAHAKGRMAVLIIDEAQSLDGEVLEQVRLLTNLETNRRKLLRIVLLGQPQLRDILARPDMLQLAQRVVARYHLGPLSRPEMIAYVMHRLSVAGTRKDLFTPAALHRLYALSGGVPRLVNVLADRALLGAYVLGRSQVDGKTLQRAARELSGAAGAGLKSSPLRAAALALGALCGTVAALAAYFNQGPPAATLAAEPVPGATAASSAPGALERPLTPVSLGSPPVSAPPEILKFGSQGPAVTRLRQDLAQLQGKAPASGADSLPVFDEDLKQEIRRFQAAQGLPADGIVGRRTRLRLEQALESAASSADGKGKDG